MSFRKEDEDFGPYIRELRLNRGLNLDHVAERLKISTNYVSQLERGKRRATYKLIIAFSEFYNVDVDILLRKSGKTLLGVTELLCRYENLENALSLVYKSNLSPEKEREIIDGIIRVIADYLTYGRRYFK
ncbi:helix-turn-helix domain-containing protein [Heyndrickxia ginsengihumi]|uniref:helix-turn-helix domain-containing protein n=1 Tax=Heyndrickxia ginsengihumi TaxID=363870 RepID=UPI003D1C773C